MGSFLYETGRAVYAFMVCYVVVAGLLGTLLVGMGVSSPPRALMMAVPLLAVFAIGNLSAYLAQVLAQRVIPGLAVVVFLSNLVPVIGAIGSLLYELASLLRPPVSVLAVLGSAGAFLSYAAVYYLLARAKVLPED